MSASIAPWHRRVGQPEGREEPRAEVVAGFLDHPRIDLLLDPVLPRRPNVIARVRGTGTGPGLLLSGISTPGTRRTGAGIRTTSGSPGIACTAQA